MVKKETQKNFIFCCFCGSGGDGDGTGETSEK